MFFPIIVYAQLNKTEVLNGTWRFIKQSSTLALPDDSDWEEITIPHTWNILDGQSGGGTDEWQNNGYYRGPGTYTCRFNAYSEKGKRMYIRFEAVSQEADVYLNGALLGTHKGAFNAFLFDVTDVFIVPYGS
jgi:beta-galactosidase